MSDPLISRSLRLAHSTRKEPFALGGKCPKCGKRNAIVNQCHCDPNNLPTRVPCENDPKAERAARQCYIDGGTLVNGRCPNCGDKPFSPEQAAAWKHRSAARLAAIADKVYAASEPREYDDEYWQEHIPNDYERERTGESEPNDCDCEVYAASEPDLEKAEQQQTQKEHIQ